MSPAGKTRGREQAGSSGTGEDRSICTPCRGTGRVVSTLGGDPHEVTCPWCDGSGSFQPGRDAQQAGPAEIRQPGRAGLKQP